MKVAVIGDLFVTNEVLVAALEKAFADTDYTFEYEYRTFDWPVVPVMKNDEIREFVGDEDIASEIVSDAEIILTHSGPVSKKVIDTAKKLKIVGAARGGPVNINWQECTKRGIPVLYAPGRNSGAVAEFTVGMMLAQSRSITRCHHSMMNEKRWRGDLYTNDVVGNELNSSVVGLIGSGAIGGKVARIVQGFGAKVIVYDPYMPEDKIREMGCEPADLDTVLSTADYISLHPRLSKETEGMIGAREIGLMKKTAYLINTARGELVQHDALYQALKEKKIAGAALDMCEAEPLPDDSPAYTLDNITVTSHLGGASIQAAEIGASVLCEGIYDYLVNKASPQYCVNPEFAEFVK